MYFQKFKKIFEVYEKGRNMVKILFSHIGEYKKSTLIAPIFIALEAILEMLIPTLMASIIDLGLNKGDLIFTV